MSNLPRRLLVSWNASPTDGSPRRHPYLLVIATVLATALVTVILLAQSNTPVILYEAF